MDCYCESCETNIREVDRDGSGLCPPCRDAATVFELRTRLAAADRLAASVRRVKAHMIEEGIAPNVVEREMFDAEADYTKMKGGE